MTPNFVSERWIWKPASCTHWFIKTERKSYLLFHFKSSVCLVATKKLNMVFYSVISLHGYYLSICGRAISLKPFGSKEDRPAFYKKKERKHCASVWLVKRKWKRMVGLVSRSLWFDGGDCQEKSPERILVFVFLSVPRMFVMFRFHEV